MIQSAERKHGLPRAVTRWPTIYVVAAGLDQFLRAGMGESQPSTLGGWVAGCNWGGGGVAATRRRGSNQAFKRCLAAKVGTCGATQWYPWRLCREPSWPNSSVELGAAVVLAGPSTVHMPDCGGVEVRHWSVADYRADQLVAWGVAQPVRAGRDGPSHPSTLGGWVGGWEAATVRVPRPSPRLVGRCAHANRHIVARQGVRVACDSHPHQGPPTRADRSLVGGL